MRAKAGRQLVDRKDLILEVSLAFYIIADNSVAVQASE